MVRAQERKGFEVNRLGKFEKIVTDMGWTFDSSTKWYRFSKDGVIVRFTRLGGGECDVHLAGSMTKVSVMGLVNVRIIDVGREDYARFILPKLDPSAVTRLIHESFYLKEKHARQRVEGAIRDHDEFRDELATWLGKFGGEVEGS
ncbi:MAG: hypothetical protein DRH30_10475 [Deltaproteobacteria bacterium]|nr:MAG: hypothetical protein DRQ32_03285 [bacterium]RLB39104.1 MAG: hypothetical protein DRH30_10475 [Deltaproteobacteria bacterium]